MSDEAHILSYSGGKDSTAMVTYAMERDIPFRSVMADVGNEHPWTMEYVRTLHEKLDIAPVEIITPHFPESDFARKRNYIDTKWREQGISDAICDEAMEHTVPSGNQFLDACILRSGFPGPKGGRFCTDRLKIEPVREQVYQPLWDAGQLVYSWQGIRREESIARRDLDHFQQINYTFGHSAIVVRPLLHWSLEDVWRQHKRHGIEPNPLYKHGAKRVGCWPCIYGRKDEIALIARLTPDQIDRLEVWEAVMSKVTKRRPSQATFFPASQLPEWRDQIRYEPARDDDGNEIWLDDGGERVEADHVDEDGNPAIQQFDRINPPIDHTLHGIRAHVDWASTTRGGRQYDLLPVTDIRQDMATDCGSWGVCE